MNIQQSKHTITLNDDEVLILSESLKAFNVKLNEAMNTINPLFDCEDIYNQLGVIHKLMIRFKEFGC